MRLSILVIVLGFPIALVMPWAFELTPEGIRRADEIDPAAAGSSSQNRAWIFVVLIADAMSLALFFLGRLTAPASRESGDLSRPSIAVLPFENLSRDLDNAYFAGGIQDEIITRLANVGDLKVISRSSNTALRDQAGRFARGRTRVGCRLLRRG